ncbi:MAG: hypothetical protein PF636_08330 [Actinomycetota bacterium]|jgi:hypothetical protein|nr:hypothetical protein [Actinomycetota bacterium]
MPEIDEVELKRGFWTSRIVDARLRETFSADDVVQASVVLAGLMGEDPHDDEGSDQAVCRLMLAAIRVSEGSLIKLAAWVEAAHQDPRDLIVAGEYTREIQDSSQDARSIDLAEYLAWVSGPAMGSAE